MSKKTPKSKQLPNQESGSAYSHTKIESPKKAARASERKQHKDWQNEQNNKSITQMTTPKSKQ